jgi:hypothetical protein
MVRHDIKSGGGSMLDRKRRFSLLLMAAMALVLALGLVAGACSSGENGGSATTGAGGAVKTYTDKTFGYSFEYPEDWKLQEGNTAEVTAGGGSAGAVAVFDPDGTKVGDIYVDLMQVSVYELTIVVDESMMSDVKVELENVLAQLEAQSADMNMDTDLTATTVNGMPGFEITYTFLKDGEPATSTLYFLFDGDIEYQLTTQSADEHWEANQPVFDAMVASFRAGTR